MDMSDKDKLELEKRNEESMSYHNPSMSTDWRYNGANFTTSSMGLIPNSNNHMVVCGDVVGPSCSTSPMADSFNPNVWDHPVNAAAALGFNELNIPSGSTSSDPLSLLKSSGLFMPNMPGMLPHSLSQFPADSAFIERAARFSSFNGGFSDMLNPFGIHSNSNNPYVGPGPVMQSSQEVMPGNGMKSYPVRQPQKGQGNSGGNSKDVLLPQENVSMEGSSPRNETTVERTNDEPKQGVSVSCNDSDEAGFSGGGLQREDGTPSSANMLGPKKRKRGNQVAEPEQGNENQQQSGETGKNNVETQPKGDQSSTPPGNKSNGKNGKQSSQASDPPKEEYIHVRARRGQATNSHSLAERVRREKISERMKFLQDLVPGCSKVTGKAVMLDEIINYVQSLQRQVEFLSMKLATVNPRLDFNIERLLAKDQMFSARAGPSPGLGFSPDMPMAYPSMHPTQPPMFQHALPAVGNSSDALRRNITSQMMNIGGGYKESAPQLPNAWDDELHNVVQMGFNASPPIENQETNAGSASSPSQMKAES